MHHLDRGQAPKPPCLDQYSYQRHTWDDAGHCKSAMREALDKMQMGCCAYCEGPLFSEAHIEHFRRKNPNHYPQLTFEWTNLFLSCDSHNHCGHYKDRPSAPAYDPNNLVKPDDEDPDLFFYFHSTGDVRVRKGADAATTSRASETIRVFHLDEPALRSERRKSVERYLRQRPGILEIFENATEQDRRTFVEMEIEATAHAHYATTVRHFLERQDSIR